MIGSIHAYPELFVIGEISVVYSLAKFLKLLVIDKHENATHAISSWICSISKKTGFLAFMC
jgi:hypothetical protein